MIVTWLDGRCYADREWLAAYFKVSQETVRKRLTSRATHTDTGRALYDYEEAHALLVQLQTRRQAPRRTT